MRGEFIGVWRETWREIWTPLFDQEDLRVDIYCELYRELVPALKPLSVDAALSLAVTDSIQLREAFDRTIALAQIELDLAVRTDIYTNAIPEGLSGVSQRRGAIENALSTIIGDLDASKALLSDALNEIAMNPEKRSEALLRAQEDIINDPAKSREALERIEVDDLTGEREVVAFLEVAYPVVEDFGGDLLANLYFNLLTGFIEKFSLRYDLRRPCTLCPTLPGMFTSLVRDLREIASQDEHLDTLMKDFEDSIRDLRFGCTDGRIKTCVGKQFNLLEAIGAIAPGVTRDTLGGMCDELGTWPHPAVRESLKKLYGFASDYPGIRHGKNAAGKLRDIDMRDMVALSILLAGFTPYLSNQLNADAVYRGG